MVLLFFFHEARREYVIFFKGHLHITEFLEANFGYLLFNGYPFFFFFSAESVR